MSDAAAVRVAIDLLRVPSRVRMIRQAPLPEGMEHLLRIAAGERESIDEMVQVTERTEPVLRQAAEFFIEQILLSPESGSYRVLGANETAPTSELRRNMALLVRWMHPDVAGGTDRSKFAGRVTQAWDHVKTSDRRAAYDQYRPSAQDKRMQAGQRPRSPKIRTAATMPGHGPYAVAQHAGADRGGLLVRAWRLLTGRTRS